MENSLRCGTYGGPTAGHASSLSGPRQPVLHAASAPSSPALTSGVPSTPVHSPIAHGHELRDIVDPTSGIDGQPGPSIAKRARKERQPNWSSTEIYALIDAKRTLFVDEAAAADGRELMTPDASKWRRISDELKLAGVSPCVRDGPACKSKWNLIIPEYKRIVDFHSRTGTNEMTYWDLFAAQRKTESLPRSFEQEIFFCLQDWYGRRPSVQPPHSRDLMSTDDSAYFTAATASEDMNTVVDSADGDGTSLQPSDEDASGDFTRSTQSPVMQVGSRKDRSVPMFRTPYRNASDSPSPMPANAIPAGVTPVLLSSSQTTDSTSKRRTGSTGVRRKSLSGHTIIAEATRATGDAMAGQMKVLADASLEVEKTKIDVQKALFSQQMQYQRKRDLRLHENAKLTNETAKLAVATQSEVVYCLTQLSSVLSGGLQTTMLQNVNTPAHTAFVHPHTSTPCTSEDTPMVPTYWQGFPSDNAPS